MNETQHTCTVVVGGDAYWCGQPAPYSFQGASGVTYWECEDHKSTPTMATPRTARKRTYRVTLADGSTHTRTTETKEYAYAVATATGVLRWSETYQAATRYAASGYPRRAGAVVLTVEQV
jgi:hypothetical protein